MSAEEEAALPNEFLFAEEKRRVAPLFVRLAKLATVDDEYGEYIDSLDTLILNLVASQRCQAF